MAACVTDREPSPAELRAVEREWPLIAAELAVVDAEVRLAADPGDGLTGRALRRAERRVLVARRALASRPVRRGRPRRGVAA